MKSLGQRVLLAVCVYCILTVAGGLYFYCVRALLGRGPLTKPLFIFGGPALSLFTHMSYFLFVRQSLILFPWLLLGALVRRARLLSGLAFAVTWLGIGWYMHDLF